MVNYKVYYFNIRGRAEGIRMVLKAAGQEYQEFNWEVKEWFSDWKAKSPSGQAPWIEIDGKPFSQTVAIERYLATQHGLMGKTPLDAFKCDIISDNIQEVYEVHLAWFKGSKGRPHTLKGEENDALLKDFQENILPNKLKCLEALAEGGGHFVGESLTWADIRFYVFTDWAGRQFPAGIVDNYPKLKGIVECIEKHPPLADHIKNRHTRLTVFDAAAAQ